MKTILTEKQIKQICTNIGKKLDADLKHEENIPVIVGVMKGSINFLMDLTKHMKTDVYMDYIQISSYSGTETTGKVTLKKDLAFNIKNRTVVLVEDIVDTGISMAFLMDFFKQHYHPKRIILVTLFDKIISRKTNIKINYSGKVLRDKGFVIGYGLDYNELGRNLPYIVSLNKNEIKKMDDRISKKVVSYLNVLRKH